MDQQEKNDSKEVKAQYITHCAPHPDCCYTKGCAATFGYAPQTGKTFFEKCTC